MRRLDGGDGRAFEQHAPEQPRRERRSAQRADRGRTGRLARERDVIRIAAERGDVVAHPLERLDLVEQAIVARRAVWRFFRQFAVGEIAEHAQTIGEIHIDRTLARQVLAPVIAVPGLAGLQRAAVDIDVHRQSLCRAGGLEDVEIQRVLADGGAAVVRKRDLVIVIADDLGKRIVDRQIGRLHAHRRKVVADAHAIPRRDVLRLAPAQFAHRRGGIGDAGKDLHLTIRAQHALHLAVAERDDLRRARAFALDRRDRPDGRPGGEEDGGIERDPPEPAEEAQPAVRGLSVHKDEQRRRGDRKRKSVFLFSSSTASISNSRMPAPITKPMPLLLKVDPSSLLHNLFPSEITLIITDRPALCQRRPHSSIRRMISLSVSSMPLRARRPTIAIVFSTPFFTMPSPP